MAFYEEDWGSNGLEGTIAGGYISAGEAGSLVNRKQKVNFV